MNLLKCFGNAVVFLLAGIASSAWSADYTFNAGALVTGTPYTQIVNHVLPAEPAGTSFIDLFNFQIVGGGTAASSVAVNLNLAPFLNIVNLQMSLYSGQNALGSLLDGPMGSGVTLMANLEPNTDYSLKVSGLTAGSLGGSYSAAIAVVPEAQTWSMILTGLAMVGLVLHRNKHRHSA